MTGQRVKNRNRFWPFEDCHVHCNDKPVNAIWTNNGYSLSESYKLHRPQ